MFTTKRECEMKKVRARLASLALALEARRGQTGEQRDQIEAALAAVYYGVAAIGAVALVLALVASAAYLGLL